MKIFQSRSGKLVELKETKEKGKYFEYEKVIQNLVENNLGEFFSGLEFVQSEYPIDDLRPDTIAFDVERKSFVIIEYKNVINKSVVDQGISYYQLLQGKQEVFVLLYHKVKGKLYDVEEINWDETRVIFISPYFTVHQLRASGFSGLPIELYEVRKYEDGIITLNKIESKVSVTMPSTKPKTKERVPSTITEYSEDDYLAGKYGTQTPTEKTRALYFKLKNIILDKFANLEPKQKKKYIGFYSKEDGSCITTIEVRKNKIMLTYSTVKKDLLPKSDFIRDVSKIGHWGVGHFQSEIVKEDDIAKALPLIQIIYENKVKSIPTYPGTAEF